MNAAQAIEILRKMHPETVLMVSDMAVGGSCEITGFEVLPEFKWANVVWRESWPDFQNHIDAPKEVK